MKPLPSGLRTPVETPLRYLALLSRKGAWSRPAEDGLDTFVVWRPGEEGDEPLGAVRRALHDEAAACGWCSCGADGRWAVTAKGRKRLRKALAAQGETAPAPKAARRPARAETNDCESAVAWLRRRNLITPEQAEAGERLRADIHAGGMTPRVTTNWDDPLSGGRGARSALEFSERASAAQERARRALAAVGPELSGILIDVCGQLEKLENVERARAWPQRSAKLVLQLALTALTRHYGYAPHPACGRVRQWGREDYRPGAGENES